MNCRTIPITDLVATIGHEQASLLLHRLTRSGGDFARKLTTWLYTTAKPTPADGTIAVVADHGEVIGWARTESWQPDVSWDTLEAFVDPPHRGRGVAAFAAAGLVATLGVDGRRVAVFAPPMLLLARRVGLRPVLFLKDDAGKWVRQ